MPETLINQAEGNEKRVHWEMLFAGLDSTSTSAANSLTQTWGKQQLASALWVTRSSRATWTPGAIVNGDKYSSLGCYEGKELMHIGCLVPRCVLLDALELTVQLYKARFKA